MAHLIKTGDFGDLTTPVQLLEMPKPMIPASLERLAALPSPRVLATHLQAPMLPKAAFKAKVIYIYRNAKDACVSGYYHHKGLIGTPSDYTFEEHARQFMKGELIFSPYPDHLKGYAKIENENLLLLRYEDVVKDRKGTIRKVAKYLNKELSDEMVEKIYEATSMDSMRQNKDFNWSQAKAAGVFAKESDFIRKGEIGDWKNHFTDAELLKEFNAFIAENLPPELIAPDE